MLQSISWNEFVTALAVIAIAYYVIATLLLYNKEITNRFRKTKEEPPEKQNQTPAANPSVMGNVRYDSGNSRKSIRTESLEAQDLKLPAAAEAEEPVDSVSQEEEFITAAVTDIITQVKVIVTAQKPKEETVSLLKSLLARVPELVYTPFCKEINKFIHESFQNHGAIHLSPEEISSWWPAEKDTLPKAKASK